MDDDGRTRRGGAAWLALATLLAGALVPAGGSAQMPVDGLEARVWLGRGEAPVVHRGDRVRLYYRTSRDAYVAIFHLDTDGTVRLLHPRVPGDDHYTRGRRDYRMLFPRSSHWQVDEDPGVGYFFLVASEHPLDFSSFRYSSRAGWDLSAVGRRVHRDPFLAMEEYVEHLLPGAAHRVHALDYVEYHVGREHRYPRFVCYDCHRFRPYVSWNPYHYRCHSFRIVIFTDPYFYPVYRYRGTRVVYRTPPSLPYGRFAFKERARGEPATPMYRRSDEGEPPGLRVPERRRDADDSGGLRPGGPAPALRDAPAGTSSAGDAERRRPSGEASPDEVPRVRERPDARSAPVIRPETRSPRGVDPSREERPVPDRPVLERRREEDRSPREVDDRRDGAPPPTTFPRIRGGDERPTPERPEPEARERRPETRPAPEREPRPSRSPESRPSRDGDRSGASASDGRERSSPAAVRRRPPR